MSFLQKSFRSETLQDFFVAVRSFTADSSLLQPTGCANSTPHTSHFLTFSHLITRTCVAQVNKCMETLGGRRGSVKGRRRDVTRSCLGSSGFSL